jgi:outer membrane receptor protein involved in Fe transport
MTITTIQSLKKPLVLFSILFIGSYNIAWSQNEGIIVSGQVLNKTSGEPVEFASVALLDKVSKKPLTGATADILGNFEIETGVQSFWVLLSSIGYEDLIVKTITIKEGKVDLGQIKLAETNGLLEEVVVRAEKSQTEFHLDKRVFNVGKDLSTTGASALEILNNVPSVNVSIEGVISLRGSSGVQILINGKPSVLATGEGNALGTITADMIEKIEVITNPSAKYDAEGTAGIINIVIKKDERKGFNGSVSLNTGTPDNHSVGISLNRRTEKFNLFSQLGAGYRSLPDKMSNINSDLVKNTSIISNGTEYRNEKFYNFILGTDYHLNDYNVFTLSGNYAYEVEEGPSKTFFSAIDQGGLTTSEWYREEVTTAGNPKYQYDFQYKKDFKDHKEHTLLASAVGSFFGKDQSSEFENKYTFGTGNLNDQQTSTNFKEAENLFKVDYTQPFFDKFTWELGSQYVINDVSNDYSVSDHLDGVWVENPQLTNLFEYNQKVFAVYSTGAFEGDKWGVKLGLRLEDTDLDTYLATTGVANSQKYKNLFPSLHSTLKVSDAFSFQAGYSSRIFRPRLWDLNPFFNIRNNFNVRTGNPDLLPEFTDSYELTSIYVLDKLSLNAAVYYRYTEQVVERIATFENGVTYTKPANIGTNKATGFEVNGKLSAANWLTFNGDFNYQLFKREGSLESVVFDFNADQWNTRINAKIGLPKDIDIEMSGNYRSKFRTIQGTQAHQTFADFGARKKILKGKGVVNLSVRDVFASRKSISETSQASFYTYSSRFRGRFITLGLSYGFGKGEAMEYSGSRRRF